MTDLENQKYSGGLFVIDAFTKFKGVIPLEYMPTAADAIIEAFEKAFIDMGGKPKQRGVPSLAEAWRKWVVEALVADLPPQERRRFAIAAYRAGFEHVDDARSLEAQSETWPTTRQQACALPLAARSPHSASQMLMSIFWRLHKRPSRGKGEEEGAPCEALGRARLVRQGLPSREKPRQ